VVVSAEVVEVVEVVVASSEDVQLMLNSAIGIAINSVIFFISKYSIF
jgi:hypothetical protein